MKEQILIIDDPLPEEQSSQELIDKWYEMIVKRVEKTPPNNNTNKVLKYGEGNISRS